MRRFMKDFRDDRIIFLGSVDEQKLRARYRKVNKMVYRKSTIG